MQDDTDIYAQIDNWTIEHIDALENSNNDIRRNDEPRDERTTVDRHRW
jgi:hypothetical protein